MSAARPASTHQTGLTAVLAVVRLVIALLNTLFADIADLPASHPDRVLHDRLMAHLLRTEARLLRDIAATPLAPPARTRTPRRATAHSPATPKPRPARQARRLPRPARAPPRRQTRAQTGALLHAYLVTLSKLNHAYPLATFQNTGTGPLRCPDSDFRHAADCR